MGRDIPNTFLKQGNEAVLFAKDYCGTVITFEVGSISDDSKGCDAKIAGIPTDIKATENLYFGNFDIKLDKFLVRQPYRLTNQAVNLFICTKDKEGVYSVKYFGTIINYFLTYVVETIEDFDKLKEILNEFDGKHYTAAPWNRTSIMAFMCTIKTKLLKEVKFKTNTKRKLEFFDPTNGGKNLYNLENWTLRFAKEKEK